MLSPDAMRLRADEEAHANLKSSYRRFMEEPDAGRKDDAGKDLIRVIFGKDAIAEAPAVR